MTVKTLHLTNNWHTESGGVATFYRELLKGAERLRRAIRVAVPAAADSIEPHGEYGRIYHMRASPVRLSPGYRILLPHQYMLPRSPLREIILAERPDLIECCDKYTLNYLAALLRRGWLIGKSYRPAVIGLSCERMDENVARYASPSAQARSFCRAYMKWLHFPMFDHHIAVSEHTAHELREASRGHKVRRGVWIMPMGAACDTFHPGRGSTAGRKWVQALAGSPEGAKLLLYAGRLAPEKNLDLLVETMATLEADSGAEFHLLVLGDGPLRAGLEIECAKRLPGSVRFAGHIRDRETLAEVFANCDAFLHPNPREPFGIAPLEAMASGLALVAPDSGGITSYANQTNAWLVSPDPGAFASAVRAACRNDEDAVSRRRAARATAGNYDWAKVTSRYFDLYDDLCAWMRDERNQPRTAPQFYSTAGNRFGREICSSQAM